MCWLAVSTHQQFHRLARTHPPVLCRAHAASDTYGMFSPGPGVYNVADVDLSVATSRYSKASGSKFGTSGRFNERVSTF